jgi:hypothetical protein
VELSWRLESKRERDQLRRMLDDGRIRSPELKKALDEWEGRSEKPAPPSPPDPGPIPWWAYLAAYLIIALKWTVRILFWGPLFPFAFLIRLMGANRDGKW